MRTFLQKWGQYLLALACVVVIVFAALYTRQEDVRRLSAQNAAANRSQTLEEAQTEAAFHAPVDGKCCQPFSGAVRTAGGLWRFDPGVSYTAAAGQSVYAVASGVIIDTADDAVALLHPDGLEFRLSGLQRLRVQAGEQVASGQTIAAVGNEGIVRIVMLKNGSFIDPAAYLPSE